MNPPRVVQLDSVDLERSVAHEGRGEIGFRRVLDGNLFPGAWNFCDYAVLEPGQSIGRHTHGANEELYLVLEGRGVMYLDEKEIDVRPGSLIVNRPGGVHGLENRSDRPLKIFVVEVALKPNDKVRNSPSPFEGLVVAGGLGTRMAVGVPHLPKPLVKVGDRPLIEWAVRRCLAAGARRVHLALGHGADAVLDWAKTLPTKISGRLAFTIESSPRGTIGALSEIDCGDAAVVAQNGDLLSAIPIESLVADHVAHRADLTIATHAETRRLELGEVLADDDGVVRDYLEKPIKSWRISSGTYVIGMSAQRLVGKCERLDFPDLVRRAVEKGLLVREFRHSAPWIDVNDDAARRLAEALFERHRERFAEELDEGSS